MYLFWCLESILQIPRIYIISAYHANLDYSKTNYSNYFIIFIHWYSNRSSIFYQWFGENSFYNLFNIILLFRGNKKIIKNSVRFAYFHESFYLSPFFLFFFFWCFTETKKENENIFPTLSLMRYTDYKKR